MRKKLRRVMSLMGVSAVAMAFSSMAYSAESTYGPWNIAVMPGGSGFTAALPKAAPVLSADSDWSSYAWVRPQAIASGDQLIAGYGKPEANARFFMLDNGRLGFWWGHQHATVSPAKLDAERWHFVAAVVSHGTLSLYMDGHKVASAKAQQQIVAASAVVAPVQQPWSDASHFGGKVEGFTISDDVLDGNRLAALAEHAPDALMRYQDASEHWPVQTRQMAGQLVPQAPATLPISKAPFSEPTAEPLGPRKGLVSDGADTWLLQNWYLASARDLGNVTGAALSQPQGYSEPVAGKPWLAATVPGTVLTTLVNRGIYPDPAYGLNNMAIPESLNEHDWWYRTRIDVPAQLKGKRLWLTFNGINYDAHIWVNGNSLGQMEGAFVRGRFDVTDLLRPGQSNSIAVRMSPPPDPGLPHEQSLLAGAGPNGGMQALDGPTFIASEGWDWIPAIRDRDTGLWQDVTLQATGLAQIGDPHVITHLPTADHSYADVDLDIPLKNDGKTNVSAELKVAFGDVQITQAVQVAPGGTVVHLRPAQYAQLKVMHPKLWWPNGYGKPNLYTLSMSLDVHGRISDQRSLKFGIREISYELSLFDQNGNLRRVLVSPDKTTDPGQRLVDVTHKGIRKTPTGWAYSMLPAAEHSPAVQDLKNTKLTPYMAIRVNGVRIAIKGGSWGTDDFIKRVSRQRLEPYFKLQRDAHLDVIRNWVGQSTEPVFYDLADEYGMLVLNDFWQSTQNYNMEPQDDALFLRNAKEVIRRYRNHPSIALWFGRNEGVPQTLLNQRLDALIASEDGTRLYMPSSNEINLWHSGPYNYRDPEHYFTDLAKGFAVEVGTPSFPTLEAFKAMMPKADQWPISDDWAYHDWHSMGNGGTQSFLVAMQDEFGKASSLKDFSRKAQMMDYVSYRAIFEGLNAHLWTQNSGRLLWMSHPSWPSTTWQIYTHDYDTQASYYGVMHAAQPVHVQMNLPNRDIAVINNTRQPINHAQVMLKVYGLDGTELAHDTSSLDALAGAVTPVHTSVDLNRIVADHDVAFVSLAINGSDGSALSRNFYWTAQKHSMLKRLNSMPQVPLQLSAANKAAGHVLVTLKNTTTHVALNTKLTLLNAQGQRILPAYYSDNYISLAPGAVRSVTVQVDQPQLLRSAHIDVRGWNIQHQRIAIDDGPGPTTPQTKN